MTLCFNVRTAQGDKSVGFNLRQNKTYMVVATGSKSDASLRGSSYAIINYELINADTGERLGRGWGNIQASPQDGGLRTIITAPSAGPFRLAIRNTDSGDVGCTRVFTIVDQNFQRVGQPPSGNEPTKTIPEPTTQLTKQQDGQKGGSVTVQDKVTWSWAVSGDEITVSAMIKNNAPYTKEYKAFTYGTGGELKDKEPDFFWKNIKAGQMGTITIKSSNDITWDINHVKPAFNVKVFTQEGELIDDRFIDLVQGKTKKNEEPSQNQDVGTVPDGRTTTPVSGGPAIDDEQEKESGGFLGGLEDVGQIVRTALIGFIAIELIKRR